MTSPTDPTGGQNPIGAAVKALHDRVTAAAAAREVPGEQESVILVDYGDPGQFEEFRAIGIALATAPVEPVDERPRTRTLGDDLHDFDIVCVAVAWTGEQDRERMMFAALDLVDLVREVLIDDPTLGLRGVVQSAYVDRSGIGWDQSPRGVQGLTEFTVRVEASRRRRRARPAA